MSIPQYRAFYQEYGTLRGLGLSDPDPAQIKHLPVGSVLHIPGDAGNTSLDSSDTLMAGYSTKVIFTAVSEYIKGATGFSGRKTIQLGSEQVNFANKNRAFQYIAKPMANMVTAQQLLVYNYGYLDMLYRYADVPESGFFRYQNKLKTIFGTIKESLTQKTLNHFIVLNVPKTLVGKSTLDTKSLLRPKALAKVFVTEELCVLREFWLWMSPVTRANSALSTFTEKELSQVNFLFRMLDGSHMVINLGFLYSWIEGNPNISYLSSLSSYKFVDIQKFWLKSMMTLQSVNSTGASVDLELMAQTAQALDEVADNRSPENKVLVTPAVDVATGTNAAPGVPNPNKDAEPESEVKMDRLMKEIDQDLAMLDKMDSKKFAKVNLDSDDDVPEAPPAVYTSDVPDSVESISAEIFKRPTAKEALQAKLDQAADEGRISGGDYRKLTNMAMNSDQQPDPFGSGLTIEKASFIPPEEVAVTRREAFLPTPATVIDKAMGFSSLNVMEEKYNTKTIFKHQLKVVQAIQRAGIVVRNHTVETMHTALGSYDLHILELKPVLGQPSVLHARIPRVSEEGTYMAKGKKYQLRRQQCDVSVRRVGFNRVGLSSYYGKCFVDRSVKKANSYLELILKRLNKATIKPDEMVRDVSPGDVFDNYFVAPYIYSGLSAHFRSFRAGQYIFNLNHQDRLKAATPEVLANLEKDGRRLIGQAPGARPIVVDMDNMFHIVEADQSSTPIGDIFDILGLSRLDAPVDFAEVTVFSQGIPLALYFGYFLGFRKLVKFLGAKHRLVEGNKRLDLSEWEYAVRFKDVSYVFDRRQMTASLILGGMTSFDKELRAYDAETFDSKAAYLRLLEAKGLSSIYVNEMENLNDLFVDPISEEILEGMNMPTTFMGLLMKAAEMLRDYHHPSGQDTDFQRSRGYERFAGFLYTELATAIKAFKNKNRTGRAKVDMSPFQVWSTLTRDQSAKHAEDINPIQALKGMEALTYVGNGGRSKESMNRESRALHVNGLGVISVDGSVDSSDVGINMFTSADPQYANTAGQGTKGRALNAATMYGTSANLTPFVQHDDGKRVAFVSIQQAHTVATTGYHAPVVRTGYESVIGRRTGEMFCVTAKQDGVVETLTPTGMTVKYADGSVKGFSLGMMYGQAEGTTYPHPIVTKMKEGQSFKQGDNLTYNTNFFEEDPILPGGIVYKGSLLTRIALMETPHTYEDSTAISSELSQQLTTTTTKVKQYIVTFRQNLLNVVKPGQKVNPEDILMIMEDEISSGDEGFSAASLEILANRSRNAPKAGYRGRVEWIEVFYHGDKNEMSASLKSLADRSDRYKADRAKSTNRPVTTGSTDSDYSHEGTPLMPQRAVVKVYINVSEPAGVGDKIVGAAQLKSVIGEVMPYTLTTESGLKVHLKFGARSFAARIVDSMISMGVYASTLEVIGKAASKAYYGKK